VCLGCQPLQGSVAPRMAPRLAFNARLQGSPNAEPEAEESSVRWVRAGALQPGQ
jgi:hypothetical protein